MFLLAFTSVRQSFWILPSDNHLPQVHPAGISMSLSQVGHQIVSLPLLCSDPTASNTNKNSCLQGELLKITTWSTTPELWLWALYIFTGFCIVLFSFIEKRKYWVRGNIHHLNYTTFRFFFPLYTHGFSFVEAQILEKDTWRHHVYSHCFKKEKKRKECTPRLHCLKCDS